MNFDLTPEQEAIKQKTRQLCETKLAPKADEWDESDEVSPQMVKILADAGLFRSLFPKEYGGDDVSSVNICLIREELGKVSLMADTTYVMSGLGFYGVSRVGSEEQKNKYLPPLAAGTRLGTFALTEPTAGSDVASILTTATEDGDFWVLNGTKRFISTGTAADYLVVFAKTDPSRGLKGLSAFIVEKGMPGFAARSMKLMFAHDLGELSFVNCRVHKKNMVGVPGQGAGIALGNLNIFRPTLAAAAIGMAVGAYERALKYAKTRIAFGQPIANYQLIQFKLADMATELDAARLVILRAAWMADKGIPSIKEASMAKLYGCETAKRVIDQAMRIHGGISVVKGYVVERLYRLIMSSMMGEGTSEIQALTIARQFLKQ